MIAKRQDERSCQDDVVEIFRSHGLWVRSLVGSLLQPGLPDLLLVSRHGRIMLLENKVWRNVRPPTTAAQLAAQLDGPQRGSIIGELWKRESHTWVYSFEMRDGVCMDAGWLTDGKGIWYITFSDAAEYFAELR